MEELKSAVQEYYLCQGARKLQRLYCASLIATMKLAALLLAASAAAFMRPLHPRRVEVELGAKRRLKSALSDAKKPKRATKKASAPVRSLDEEIAKRERPEGVAVGDYLESLRSAETAAAEAVDLSKQAAALADDAEFAECVEEIRAEVASFGAVAEFALPRRAGDFARAPDAAATCFVKYELVSSAVKAHAALHAREFDGNVVRASFLRPEVLGW